MKKSIVVLLAILVCLFFSCRHEMNNNEQQILSVTFDSNGGELSDIFSLKVLKGEQVGRPADPIKEGYSFIGWYTSHEEIITSEDIPFDFSSKIYENVKLYAKYVPGKLKKIMYTDGSVSTEYIKPLPILGIMTDFYDKEIHGDTLITKILKNGIEQQQATYRYVYNHPINKFVAGFIGSPPMNFLTVKIIEKGGKLVADGGSFEIIPTEEQAKTLKEYVGKDVVFGIRPEDMEYSKTPENESNMEMKVSDIEPLGAEVILFLQLKTQSVVVRTDPANKILLGDTVNIVPLMEKAKFFDKDTELNICEVVREF